MTTLLAASNDRMVLVIGLTLVAGIYLLSIFFSRPVKWSRVFLVIVVWSVVLNWALLNYIDDRQFVVPKDFQLMDAIADFRKVLEIDSLDQDAKESLRRLGSDGPSSGKQE